MNVREFLLDFVCADHIHVPDDARGTLMYEISEIGGMIDADPFILAIGFELLLAKLANGFEHEHARLSARVFDPPDQALIGERRQPVEQDWIVRLRAKDRGRGWKIKALGKDGKRAENGPL